MAVIPPFDAEIRRGGLDKYGDRVEAAVVGVAKRCDEWPSSDQGGISAETMTSYVAVTTRRTLWVPDIHADIRADDMIVYPDGSQWHVVGDPFPWVNTVTGNRWGLEVTLERSH